MIQTGFGAFVPAYLSVEGWRQTQIGAVLSIETIASMLFQIPGGALVDATAHRRRLMAGSIVMISVSAAMIAAMPSFWPVAIALVLHDFVSAAQPPAIAAISLLQVGQAKLSERLGRNARFAAIGGMIGAAILGLFTLVGSSQNAMFLFTAALAVPAIAAVRMLAHQDKLPPPVFDGHFAEHVDEPVSFWTLIADRRIMIFLVCLAMFHLSSAAIMPLISGSVALADGKTAGPLIAAYVIVPQLIVAAFSPMVGRRSEKFGRRPLLILGFASTPLRAILFAMVHDPYVLVFVQILEGVGGAVIGVMVPLVAADLTRGSGRYSLCMGMLGFAMAAGAAVSTLMAGAIADILGRDAAFGTLAIIGVVGTLAVGLVLPETRPTTLPGTV